MMEKVADYLGYELVTMKQVITVTGVLLFPVLIAIAAVMMSFTPFGAEEIALLALLVITGVVTGIVGKEYF